MALIVSLGKIIEALNDVISASLEFTVAARGLGTLLVAAALTAALIDLGDDPDRPTRPVPPPPRPDRRSGATSTACSAAWPGP